MEQPGVLGAPPGEHGTAPTAAKPRQVALRRRPTRRLRFIAGSVKPTPVSSVAPVSAKTSAPLRPCLATVFARRNSTVPTGRCTRTRTWASLRRHPRLTPYLLLAPGALWLAAFFLVPLGFLAYQSLESGSFDIGYAFTWAWGNYWDAIHDCHGEFLRSFYYAGIATVLALLLSYPVAYWIAFRGGRWRTCSCSRSSRRSSSPT